MNRLINSAHLRLLGSKYTYLLFTLLFLIMLSPYIGERTLGQYLQILLITFTLIAALIAIPKKKHLVVTFVILAIISTISGVLNVYHEHIFFFILDDLTSSMFFLAAIIVFAKEVMGSRKVTRDTMIGSICIYLLIGVAYAFVYSLIQIVMPGSFVNLVHAQNAQPAGTNFFYFSFITLTTVGYGDIAVLTAPAKSIVILESITGIFYMALLVSKLVGLRINEVRLSKQP